MSCLSPPCTAAGQSLPALGPCRVGMEVRQAGIVPGHQEEAMGVLGTASLPSSQAICSCGSECCELAWGQSGAAVWPLCTRRSTEPCWVLHASTATGWSPGASCLGVAKASCAAFAGVLPVQRPCCACPGMPVAAARGAWALCCSAEQGAWSGQGSTACLALGTGLTSSPGPWPAVLTSEQPVSHMQPYLLAWSCLQGLITSGQGTRWCSAAGSSHAAL